MLTLSYLDQLPLFSSKLLQLYLHNYSNSSLEDKYVTPAIMYYMLFCIHQPYLFLDLYF